MQLSMGAFSMAVWQLSRSTPPAGVKSGVQAVQLDADLLLPCLTTAHAVLAVRVGGSTGGGAHLA